MKRFSHILLLILTATWGWAVTPNADEQASARSFFDCYFSIESGSSSSAYLQTVSEDVPDVIGRGISWRGTPYQIGDRVFKHGIAFNASKRIRIHMGGPGEQFNAFVGLENNDDTQRGAAMGNGSARFHVYVKGQEVFVSPILRLKDSALAVDIPLQGEESFEIEVDDAGDGRGWDQALWAEAVVRMQKTEGENEPAVIRLQDIPVQGEQDTNPYLLSFLFDGQPSRQLLSQWTRRVSEEKEAELIRRTVIYTDSKTQIQLRVEGTLDLAFPSVEWIAYIKNAGKENTPILQDILALDAALPLPANASSRLYWAKGAVASFDDFAPQESKIEAGKPLRFQPGGGRSSNQVLPFFNIAGGGGGVITAIGWSGEWAFECDAAGQGSTALKAGLAKTHLRLYPGEEIRTPRMMMLFYEGDRWRGQNLLRQYILARHRPRRNGEPITAPITCGNWGATSVDVHLDNVQKIDQNNLPIEYYWIDAEWYGNPGNPGSWAVNVGNWAVKPSVYPNGFKPLSTALNQTGRHLMLWFEPERVYKETPWFKEHHDWLLDLGRDSALYNLGNPEARQFLTDFISQKITEFGLGCYRQDFNIDPLPFWQAADAPDRVGMTEIRYIEGLYSFWDGLLSRHPHLLIDNCASGGRRIDLETIHRSTPFWRTDGPRDPIAHQCHTYGLLPWVPLSSTSQDRPGDDYEFRSSMCSALCLNWWVHGDAPAQKIPDDFPYAWANETLKQYLDIRKYYYGDYYPLTRYSQTDDAWMAYQLDRPDLGEGVIVALKRPKSPYREARFSLQGLEPEAMYQVVQGDPEPKTTSGRELLEKGISISLEALPDSRLIFYKRIKEEQ